MFRPKRKQKTIFDHDIYLPEDRQQALEKSWAGPFRKTVLPMIQEEPFRPFYCQDNGRPNVPVAILTGLCILKELYNLTDQEVLDSLEFDLRWQYAFDITVSEAHICQKTLHNFRVLVTTNEQARQIFQGLTDDLIAAAGLSTEKQRLDSTHILSNLSHLTRLGLFIRVIEGFLKRLKKRYPKLYEKLPQVYDQVYLQRSGYFADVKSSQARRRLVQCARHLFDLVGRFRGQAEISHLQAYRLMERLLREQCQINEDAPEPVTLKDPQEIPADSLQSPADPDATYGRKGKGYKASLTETCAPENPFQVITDCPSCRFLSVCRVKRCQGNYRLKYALADLATSRRREQQETAHFQERDKIRSGIEATISEANRLTGLKRVWTRGQKRVRMSVFFKALAINIKRFIQYALEKAKKALAPTPGLSSAVHFASIVMLQWHPDRLFGSCGYALAA